MWFLENAWLIPVIPTIGYFVILLLGKRMPLKGAEVGFGTLAASFVLACGTVYQWIQRVDHYSAGHEGALGTLASFGRSIIPAQAEAGHEVASFVPPVIRQWTWWQVSDFKFTLGIQVDGPGHVAVGELAGAAHVEDQRRLAGCDLLPELGLRDVRGVGTAARHEQGDEREEAVHAGSSLENSIRAG